MSTRETHGTHSATVICAIFLAMGTLYFASIVLIPLVLGVLFFLLLDPWVDFAERHRVSRKLAAPVLILILAAITGFAGYGTYSAFGRLARQAPQYQDKIRGAVRAFQGKAKEIQKGTQSLIPKDTHPVATDVQKVEVVESPAGGGITQFLMRGLDSVVALITAAVVVPILALFLLLEKPFLKPAVAEAFSRHLPVSRIGTELREMVRGFFLGNFLVGLGTSAAFYALFLALGLENKLPIALFSGFINLIPILGAVLGAVLPALQAALQFDTLTPMLTILAVSFTLHLLVANLVIPKIVGGKINVNATASTIGLVFWGWIWGPIGLLIAIPLVSVIRIFLCARDSTRALGNLLAESPEGGHTRLWVARPRRPAA